MVLVAQLGLVVGPFAGVVDTETFSQNFAAQWALLEVELAQ